MSLRDQLSAELKRLAGFSSSEPNVVALRGQEQLSIDIDFTAVDSMSSSFREIRLSLPTLADAGFDTLQKWAEGLCSRITYLLEGIGPLELDPQSAQVLIRSTPPDQQSGAAEFYEILLQSHGNGNFSLRRYSVTDGNSVRAQLDIRTTHELLHKLVNDIAETIPAGAA